jgi:hypothetical protein
MPEIYKWWASRPEQKFWLEVTRREDLGVNLKAPQTDEQGQASWSYSLIREIREGDIVYHYDGNIQAIVARSVATGEVWEDDIVWAARGLSARTANIAPHVRPGWYLGVEQFEQLTIPVTLERIRGKENGVRSVFTSLAADVGKPLYFPFELGNRPIRPMQGYLFKLPVGFVQLFGLETETVAAAESKPIGTIEFGDDYRTANEFTAIEERDPFAIDPAIVERGIRGHAQTQNCLARHILSLGAVPRSPKVNEPNFDVAWQIAEMRFVAEVKSLTIRNEENQLRLGLGQVLRYAYQLDSNGGVVPVLVAERQPSDSSWEVLCRRLGVVLAWPEVLIERLPGHSALAGGGNNG